MMIVVAAVAVWMGLDAAYISDVIYILVLLVGPLAMSLYLGRHNPTAGMHWLRAAAWIFCVIVLPGVGICYLGLAGLFCWTMKDGLGPDAIRSSGLEAFLRFWGLIRWHLLIGAAVIFVGPTMGYLHSRYWQTETKERSSDLA